MSRMNRVFRKALVMLYTCFDIRGLPEYYITIDSEGESPTVREVLRALEQFFLSEGDKE